MMEKAVFLACSNAWLGESVNGKLLAISEAQGSRGNKARRPFRLTVIKVGISIIPQTPAKALSINE